MSEQDFPTFSGTSIKVQVWIYCRNPKSSQYLYLLLFTRPERGAFWQPVTGGVEQGESLQNAAYREASEETQLAFTSEPTPLNRSFEFESRGKKIIEHGYKIQTVENCPNVKLDPHEHTHYEWVTFEEAISRLKFSSNQEMLQWVQKSLFT